MSLITWVYVDETKRAGYVLAAVSLTDAEMARRVVRGLIVPGRNRVHMHNETSRHRREIVSTLASMSVTATVYDAARCYRTEREARAGCLAALVKDLARAASVNTRLVIEQDDSLVRSDRQEMYRLTRAAGIIGAIEYGHRRASSGGDPLLALPDVVAWCWVRSGDWRRRIDPILSAVRQVGT